MTSSQWFGIALTVIVGGFLTFFVIFFGCLWWDSAVLHDHDGQAGIGYFFLAVMAVPVGMIVSGLLSVRYVRRRNELKVD